MNALVIGGGIGGTTAGIALSRKGINTKVFERASNASEIEVGAGIHIWTNAMRALNEIGVGERVYEVSGPGAVVEYLQFRSEDGTVWASWPVGKMGRKANAPTIGINRAELLPALASALDPGVLQLGMECVSFEQDANGVTAQFANGKEERGDVLIGADGANSFIRERLVNDGRPYYSGYTIWQGVVDFEHPAAPIGYFPLFYGRGERFAFYRVNQQRVYWFAVANAPEGGKDPAGGPKDALLRRFGGWGEPIEALIQATQGSIRRKDLYYRKPIDRWSSGRVTLLGDAAHAMTFDLGQGAGQGMEDAYTLAECLSTNGDAASSLRTYEARRVKRAAHMQTFSRRAGLAGQLENPVACWLRAWVIKLVFTRGFVLRSYEKDMLYKF